jgi:hypothetical protein
MVIATVRMTTVEHPHVDEGLPYEALFFCGDLLLRGPNYFLFSSQNFNASPRRGASNSVLSSSSFSKSMEIRFTWPSASRIDWLNSKTPRHGRLEHHLPFGHLNDGGFVGAEIGFEYLVVLAHSQPS